jgi:hypothetical protein
MKQTFGILFLSSIFAITLYSCKKDTAIPEMGYDYFPDKVGTYVIYDVDSTYYDDFFTPVKAKNYKFQIKEKIQSTFLDNQNRVTLRLERYVKQYDTIIPYADMTWKLRDVWTENRTATTAEKVEENIRYIRLIFPVRLNKTWNANAQNLNDERDFSYVNVDEPLGMGGISFDRTLKTVYDDGGGILTSREYRTENYARNVGLIYRQEIVVESQPKAGATSVELQSFFSKTIMNRITSGYQYSMTINSYGVE